MQKMTNRADNLPSAASTGLFSQGTANVRSRIARRACFDGLGVPAQDIWGDTQGVTLLISSQVALLLLPLLLA